MFYLETYMCVYVCALYMCVHIFTCMHGTTVNKRGHKFERQQELTYERVLREKINNKHIV